MSLERLIDSRLGWISVTPQSYLAVLAAPQADPPPARPSGFRPALTRIRLLPGPVTTVHLPNELAARLSASAARHGVGVDDVTYMLDNDV